jgi:4-aminobutyrate aminotransferase
MIRSGESRKQAVTEGDVNRTLDREEFLSRHLDAGARALLERDSASFLHQSLSTPCLNALVSARGSVLTDVAGRQILDFHGNSVHQLGHAHPRVVEAVKRQLDEMAFCPRRFTNEPAVACAERLAELTGGRLSKVLLAPGGSLAIGMAMKLARIATGRHKTLSMWGAFHGAGLDAISIGGESVFREHVGPLLPGCEHVMPCRPSRCGAGCSGGGLVCASALEAVLEQEPDIGAVIAEPVRCTTVDIPHAEYWKRVRAACDRHGVLLVFDEIPTGLGRTGRMFSYEHFGVEPDILVLGKGLGGGVIAQAAVLARPELDVAGFTALGHYTHEKSPLGAAAALATLDVLRDEGLVERSWSRGNRWRQELGERLGPTGLVGEIRGLGMLIGVEMRSPTGSERESAALASRVLYLCMERGLSLKVSDGRVLTLVPPLNVSEEELGRATGILAGAFATAMG